MRTAQFRLAPMLGIGVVLASQMSACIPGCPQCSLIGGNGGFRPVPLVEDRTPSGEVTLPGVELGGPVSDGPFAAAAPQTAGVAQWSAGPEGALASANESTDFGIGGQAVCEITGQPLGFATGASVYFPDVGSAYGAWAGYRYNVDSGGAIDFFGVGAATWSHYGYDSDDYEIPEGEFFASGAGGGAAFQQGFGGGGDAFGLRIGGGAQLADEDRRVRPYAEAGYDIYLLGDDFDNQFRLGAGVQIPLGGR